MAVIHLLSSLSPKELNAINLEFEDKSHRLIKLTEAQKLEKTKIANLVSYVTILLML